MIRPRADPGKRAAALLAWYDAHRRDLPWRAPPGRRADPYAVWLSEIMLQQTTVAAVAAYYEKFLARWPTVAALAQAPIEEVLGAWAGLGYYARARNLHACAHKIVKDHGGRFPKSEAQLRNLPGVGPYTAGAVAAIAFDAPCAAIDGNVERVVTRLHAIGTPVRRARTEIRQRVEAMLPPARAGDFAQALMDLGAMICIPRAPRCEACPLSAVCLAFKAGEAENYPVKEKKAQRPKRRGAIFILRRGDATLLRRRPPGGLFGGMSAFPSTPFTRDVPPEEWLGFAPRDAAWRALPEPVLHVFTHFALAATIYVARDRGGWDADADCRWAAERNLDKEGLPTLMRKAAAMAGLV